MIDAHFSQERLPGNATLPTGWFAVSNHWVKDADTTRRRRNRLYRIKSDYGATYRTLQFAPNLKYDAGGGTGTIAIDYQAWIELQGLTKPDLHELRLRIRPAHFWENVYAAWSHPDPNTRLANRIAVLSLFLGLLSLALSIRH